jgi:hypothetical protein
VHRGYLTIQVNGGSAEINQTMHWHQKRTEMYRRMR